VQEEKTKSHHTNTGPIVVEGSRIIVALDFSDQADALAVVDHLSPELCRLKVGKELFTAAGPGLVEILQRRGFEVFLDLKFHDIPNTVAKAVEVAARLGVWMVDVHISGGPRMLEAARAALDRDRAGRTLLVGVSVLTSMTESEMKAIGWQCSLQEQVLRFALLANEAGLDGLVCSAQEANGIRTRFADSLCLVTPGIRPTNTEADDQRRVVTPAEAIAAGSNYLVVGRPITCADDPAKALEELNSEVNHVIS